MEWWKWLLLILVLLSLIVLIIWLLRLNARSTRRRKAAISEAIRQTRPPVEPAKTLAEAQEEAAEPAKTLAEAQEKAAEPQAIFSEAAAEAKETAVEIEQEMEQAKETTEMMASRTREIVAAEPPPDDLKIIEGIGPKISGVLQAAGIKTLAQLAATEVDEIERILREAKIRLGDPGTWPEQAALAAKAQWDELAALQDSLKGGRRV